MSFSVPSQVVLAKRVVEAHVLAGRGLDVLRRWDQAALACVDAAAFEAIFAKVPVDCESEAKMRVLDLMGGGALKVYPGVRQRAVEWVRECMSAIAALARKSETGEVVTDDDVASALAAWAETRQALWGVRPR